jgi:Protein of unknown function (DUF4230)
VRPVIIRVLVAAGLLGLLACVVAISFFARQTEASRHIEMRATPGVITAIHDIARLEATQFHIEKVVEVSEAQSRLWGLVEAKDALLLVAVGDVIAGVDLGKVRDGDVRVDEASRSVQVRLPAPEVFASTLDERATHVYARTTDVLAARNEQLEGEARRTAEEQMRKAAIDAGILDRARASADQTLRAVLRPLGYQRVELDWADRS